VSKVDLEMGGTDDEFCRQRSSAWLDPWLCGGERTE
jgi:hypothetical protein